MHEAPLIQKLFQSTVQLVNAAIRETNRRNLGNSREIPDHVNSYLNDWISPTNFFLLKLLKHIAYLSK